MNRWKAFYVSFLIAWWAIVFVFITISQSTNLWYALLFYPVLAYIIFKVMLEHRGGPHVKQQATPVSLVSTGAYTVIHHSHLKEEPTEISDSDKRMFLKLIGSTGIFLFFYSILNKRIGSLLFNDMATPSRNLALGNAVPADIKPDEDQIKEQYRIAEVDDSVVAYFGYINKDGGWYIMKADTENGSFRYAKGDFDFAVHWQNRQNLQYNYFHLVF